MVVALGGDGTVNEVVNGLLTDGPQRRTCRRWRWCRAARTNVFARALGLPRDPVEATGAMLDALRAGRRRRIGLGLADDRWFTFNAGHRLGRRGGAPDREARGRAGEHDLARAVRPGRARALLHRGPPAPGDHPGAARRGAVDRLHLAIVANTAPWTYLGDRPVQPSPEASFDTGLDLFAPAKLGIAAHSALRSPGAAGPAPLRQQAVAQAARPGGVHAPGEPAAGAAGRRGLARRARVGAVPVGPGRAARSSSDDRCVVTIAGAGAENTPD